MSNQSYTATILVDQSPKQALEAIRTLADGGLKGSGQTPKIGDEFQYHYQNLTHHDEALELVPGKPSRVARY